MLYITLRGCEIFGPKSCTKGADVNVSVFFGKTQYLCSFGAMVKTPFVWRVRRLDSHIRLRDWSLQVSWIWALTQRNSFNSQRFVQADMDVVGGFYKKNWGELFSNTGIRWVFRCWEGVGLFQGTYIYIYILLIITVYDVYIFMYTYSYLCASSYHIYTLEHRGYHYVFSP